MCDKKRTGCFTTLTTLRIANVLFLACLMLRACSANSTILQGDRGTDGQISGKINMRKTQESDPSDTFQAPGKVKCFGDEAFCEWEEGDCDVGSVSFIGAGEVENNGTIGAVRIRIDNNCTFNCTGCECTTCAGGSSAASKRLLTRSFAVIVSVVATWCLS